MTKTLTVKKINLICIAATLLCFIACSKKSDNSTPEPGLSNKPDAKAQYDSSSFGIYKGVFVGSSGTVLINIKNSDNTVTAVLNIDGKKTTYLPVSTVELNSKTEITFTTGNNRFIFTVGPKGTNPSFTLISLDGHPDAQMQVVKETSKEIVHSYEGTYSGLVGKDHGIFNIIFKFKHGDPFIVGLPDEWIIDGVGRSLLYKENFAIRGIVDNAASGGMKGTFPDGTFVGRKSTDIVEGSWKNTLLESGQFIGRRTQ